MAIDLNRFRTLVPLDSLYDDSLQMLADKSRLIRVSEGEPLPRRSEPNSLHYLIQGSVKLPGEQQLITPASRLGAHPLPHLPADNPVRAGEGGAILAEVPGAMLEQLLAWGQLAPELDPVSLDSSRAPQGPGLEESEWMMMMLRSPLFLKLPAANIQDLFLLMQPVEVRSGQVIVSYGEPGDYYYMIRRGRAQVSRPGGKDEKILATLGRGDAFGEQALISEAPRNATITMLSDGLLMRLSRQDFMELMESPVIRQITESQARELEPATTQSINIRLPHELTEEDGEALNLPLYQLHERRDELEPGKVILVTGGPGPRESAAVFLLQQLGFDARMVLPDL